jgi:uncharacterized membrane protein
MRLYNYIFLGLFRLASKTEYKEIEEYVASFGMAFIIEMNLNAVLISMGFGYLLKAYSLIIMYILLIILNVYYYGRNSKKIEQMNIKVESQENPNIRRPEALAMIVLAESALLPLIYIYVKGSV